MKSEQERVNSQLTNAIDEQGGIARDVNDIKNNVESIAADLDKGDEEKEDQ